MEKHYPSEQLRVGEHGLLYSNLWYLFKRINTEPNDDTMGGLFTTYSFNQETLTETSLAFNPSHFDMPLNVTVHEEYRKNYQGDYLSLDGDPRGYRHNRWGDVIYDIDLHYGDIVLKYHLATFFDKGLSFTRMHKTTVTELESVFEDLSPEKQMEIVFGDLNESDAQTAIHSIMQPEIVDVLEEAIQPSEVSKEEYRELIELVKSLKLSLGNKF